MGLLPAHICFRPRYLASPHHVLKRAEDTESIPGSTTNNNAHAHSAGTGTRGVSHFPTQTSCPAPSWSGAVVLWASGAASAAAGSGPVQARDAQVTTYPMVRVPLHNEMKWHFVFGWLAGSGMEDFCKQREATLLKKPIHGLKSDALSIPSVSGTFDSSEGSTKLMRGSTWGGCSFPNRDAAS